jgi:hypothetical protein
MTRVCNAGARERETTIDAGWLLYLSELARQSRGPPLTPADCDLRGLPFMPMDVVRILDSDLFALVDRRGIQGRARALVQGLAASARGEPAR